MLNGPNEVLSWEREERLGEGGTTWLAAPVGAGSLVRCWHTHEEHDALPLFFCVCFFAFVFLLLSPIVPPFDFSVSSLPIASSLAFTLPI